MSSINEILQDAKKDFETYAKENGLKVEHDPFDIDLVRVEVIQGDSSYLLDKEVPLGQLTNIPKYLRQVDLEAFDVLFKDDMDEFKIRIRDMNDIRTVMNKYKGTLFQKFGYVTVEFYRDNNQILETKVNNLKGLINIIKKSKDEFRGIKDKEKRTKFDRHYSDSGGGVGLILVGNIIIDEFGNFLADEYGNCLSFE